MKTIPILISILLIPFLLVGQESFYDKHFRKIEKTEKIGKKLLSQHLDDNKIPSHFKTTFLGDGYNLNDDDTSLAIIDSLFSNDTERHPFYFVLVTRTLWWADGAYAEPLGSALLKFVSIRTNEFFNYFNQENTLTDYDFNNWADQISMEIGIEHEGTERKFIEDLQNELLEKSPEKKDGILKFIEIVKKYSP